MKNRVIDKMVSRITIGNELATINKDLKQAVKSKNENELLQVELKFFSFVKKYNEVIDNSSVLNVAVSKLSNKLYKEKMYYHSAVSLLWPPIIYRN